MGRLRLSLVAATLVIALIAGGGVASAGVEWCDWGCPPPFEDGMKDPPRQEMPTPQFQNNNGKFEPVSGGALLPPGIAKN